MASLNGGVRGARESFYPNPKKLIWILTSLIRTTPTSPMQHSSKLSPILLTNFNQFIPEGEKQRGVESAGYNMKRGKGLIRGPGKPGWTLIATRVLTFPPSLYSALRRLEDHGCLGGSQCHPGLNFTFPPPLRTLSGLFSISILNLHHFGLLFWYLLPVFSLERFILLLYTIIIFPRVPYLTIPWDPYHNNYHLPPYNYQGRNGIL